jgi:hypothetical protein
MAALEGHVPASPESSSDVPMPDFSGSFYLIR